MLVGFLIFDIFGVVAYSRIDSRWQSLSVGELLIIDNYQPSLAKPPSKGIEQILRLNLHQIFEQLESICSAE